LFGLLGLFWLCKRAKREIEVQKCRTAEDVELLTKENGNFVPVVEPKTNHLNLQVESFALAVVVNKVQPDGSFVLTVEPKIQVPLEMIQQKDLDLELSQDLTQEKVLPIPI
jgi:hypothetical protein